MEAFSGSGFGACFVVGGCTAAAGLTLLARDWVHHGAGRPEVLACIATGALTSAALAGSRVALASATAFLLSELADLIVYQRLRRRGWIWPGGNGCVGEPLPHPGPQAQDSRRGIGHATASPPPAMWG
ncbi:hypothetical protein GCM10023322_79330 [Rugosimonospora acidiphila]|uniref:Uncharacterized protein n=1 Tax=Rugosimonospora acidiphila TaxID=556531 RepID=A0ABP9SQE2_9ACTN